MSAPTYAALALLMLSSAAVAQVDNPTAALEDPSNVPIQPGAPKYVHGGTFNASPWTDPPLSTTLHANQCTMNFIFRDAVHTYVGVAGHCALPVGSREDAPDIGEFGTVVFRISCLIDVCGAGHSRDDDFGLIQVDADKLALVSPVMRGVDTAPAGFTTSDETAVGDPLATYGYGIPFATVPAARLLQSVLVSDDASHYTFVMPATSHSGSPVIRTSDGKAVGIVAARYADPVVESVAGDMEAELVGGPTVERILVLLAQAGFDVTLVTQGDAEPARAGSDNQSGAGGLGPASLMPLALLALRRRRIAPAVAAPLFALLLPACGKNDSGQDAVLEGLCESIGGGAARITSASPGCDVDPVQDLAAALDRNYGSYALLRGAGNCAAASHTTILATAQSGVVFPAGQSAGALIRMPLGSVDFGSSFEMKVTTYLDGAVQDTGVAVPGAGPGNGQDGYVGIATTNPFDAVELVLDVSGFCGPGPEDGPCNDDVRIYELCKRGEG